MQRIIHHVKGHYHKHYRSRFAERAHWVFMFDGTLVLIILGLLTFGSFFAFFYDPPRDSFRAAIVSQAELRAGESGEITVRVSNEGKQDLHDASFITHFPAEFRIEGSTSNSVESTIGELKGGDSKEYRFKGLLIGPPNKASVYIHFRATRKDGQSDERLTRAEISWSKNLLEMGFVTPDSFIAGQSTPFTLVLKNGTNMAFDHLRVAPKFPETLKIKLASPPLAKGSAFINDLQPGEQVQIEFVGTYLGNEPGVTLDASLWWIEGAREASVAVTSDRREAISPNLKMEAVLDPKDTSIRAGDGAAVIVRYANEGSFTLENVQFGIEADPRLTRESAPGIVSAKPPKIDRLEPGQKGEFAAVVWTKETFPSYVNDPKLTMTPTARFSVNEPKITDALISGAPVELKIAGQASLTMAARYFTSEGDQLGRGTLPPRAGKETRYWVSVGVTGGTSMIKDSKVEVLLPKNVAWTGKASATAGDAPQFDASRGVIVWKIGELAAHAGVNVEEVGASFEVVLTPTAEQVGTMPALAAAAGFSGTDSWTDILVVDSHSTVTTALPNDAFIRGRTTVRP